MENLGIILQERWYVFIAAIFVLFFIIKLVKAMIKWLLIIVIAAAVLWYGYHLILHQQNQNTRQSIGRFHSMRTGSR